MLSAYDATASLLSLSGDGGGAPVFEVRYLAMTKESVVERVGLERLRPVPAASTPYRVFKSTLDGIQVEDDVELQWKGMASHPFGWCARRRPPSPCWRMLLADAAGRRQLPHAAPLTLVLLAGCRAGGWAGWWTSSRTAWPSCSGGRCWAGWRCWLPQCTP